MLFAGIDENGLGPILGPLVVTGVACYFQQEEAKPLIEPANFFPGIRDSKEIFNRNKPSRFESVALAILKLVSGKIPSSLVELVETVEPDYIRKLPCITDRIQTFCLQIDSPIPLWAEMDEVNRVMDEIANRIKETRKLKGFVQCRIFCPMILNKFQAMGQNKFAVDLTGIVDVVKSIHRLAGVKMEAVSGKVGSRIKYGEEMEMRGIRNFCLKQNPVESEYELQESGIKLKFVLNADRKYIHVSMASIIGKYIRELFMESICRSAEAATGIKCGSVSGYRDRKTKNFIQLISPILQAKNIQPHCFIRLK